MIEGYSACLNKEILLDKQPVFEEHNVQGLG